VLGREPADYGGDGALFNNDASLADMAHTGRPTQTRLRPVNAAICTALKPGENRRAAWRNGFPRDSGAETQRLFMESQKVIHFFDLSSYHGPVCIHPAAF